MLPLLLGLAIGVGASAVLFMRGEGGAASEAAAVAVPPPKMPAAAEPAAASAQPEAAPAAEPAGPDPVDPEPQAASDSIAEPAVAAVETAAPSKPAAPPKGGDPRPPRAPAAASPRPSGVAVAESEQPVAEQPLSPEKEQPSADEEAVSAKQADRTVDDLLDQALASPEERAARDKREQALFASSSVPQTPSREEVTRAMTVLLPAIRGCAMGQSGLATASIVVRNTGKVASVSVSGAPFSGAASGRCMEGVVRRARFPRFKQDSFRIKFPFAIQ